jgi:hypothetical protein
MAIKGEADLMSTRKIKGWHQIANPLNLYPIFMVPKAGFEPARA